MFSRNNSSLLRKDTVLPAASTLDNNLPRIFEHQQFGNLRVIMDEKTGEPWFVAKDVADALGYSNSRDAVSKHCKHQASVAKRDGGSLSIIPQGDVYRLVARSKLPTAQKIEEWIFDEVLPSIRKHGLYATPTTIEAMIADPSFAIRLLTNIQEERQARMAAELAHKEAQATGRDNKFSGLC